MHLRWQAAARFKGLDLDEVEIRSRLGQLDALMPDLVDLHKLKAADWYFELHASDQGNGHVL